MRIGIDYTAAARQRAGIGRYTRELIQALLALDAPDAVRYVLFAASGGTKAADWAPSPHPRVALRSVPLSDEWLARIWHRLRLPIPIEWVTGPVDVLYSPDFVLPPTRRGARLLLTVHDLSFVHYPDHFVPKLVRYLNRVVPQSVARADLVLADSVATQRDLAAHLGVPLSKVQVLYSGVSSRFCPEAEAGERERLRARYGVGERPYVLSVGTIQPRKNYGRLIEAFVRSGLGQATGGVELVVAGGRGWLYQDVLDAAARHSEQVRILGFVEDADLPALYRQAAVFAFPSLYEGFGLPVLEAMASGAPVICSNVSSLPEVAGAAAIQVDPLDVEGLAAALARLNEDADLRQELAARGREQAARFTWQGAARQLLDVFTALAAR